MGWSQTYCVVCAGPAENPINERYSEWLNSHVGITYDNNPKRIFGYDGLCFYKAQDERHLTLQGQDEDYDMSFWAFDTQECQLTYDTICDFEEDHRGVTCHTACYELLESSLNYRLQLHDIWPLVMRNPAGYGARVEEDYGGMVKYHCQVNTSPQACCCLSLTVAAAITARHVR